jgi:hypothetical protein
MGTRSLDVSPQPTEKPLDDFCPSVRCGPCFSRNEWEHSSRVAQSRKTGVETISEFTEDTKENLLK